MWQAVAAGLTAVVEWVHSNVFTVRLRWFKGCDLHAWQCKRLQLSAPLLCAGTFSAGH